MNPRYLSFSSKRTNALLHCMAVLAIASAVPSSGRADDRGLLAREALWPYRVALVEPWDDAGRRTRPLSAGTSGVLIRVEEGARVRVDFGRDGLGTLPASATDLHERMNAVSAGEIEKDYPNFVMAIGPRMLDATTSPPVMRPLREVAGYTSFLCVYLEIDRSDAELAALADSVQSLTRGRDELLTVLFPIGHQKDPVLAERLRTIEWEAVFVPDHLADPYVPTLVDDGTPFPHVQLTSPEGRIIVEGPWNDGTQSALAETLGVDPD